MHWALMPNETSPAGAVRNAAKAADDVPSSAGIQKTLVVLESLDFSEQLWALQCVFSVNGNDHGDSISPALRTVGRWIDSTKFGYQLDYILQCPGGCFDT